MANAVLKRAGRVRYAELHCLSNFSFLRGASHPEELVTAASEMGYAGLALTDECSLAGVVRAHVTARELPLQLIVGSEFVLPDASRIIVLATDRRAYGDLSALISQARLAAAKGRYAIDAELLERSLLDSDCLLLWVPGVVQPIVQDVAPFNRMGVAALAGTCPGQATGRWLKARFDGRLWLAVEYAGSCSVRKTYTEAATIAGELNLPMLASGNVHMHTRSRRMLQDTLTAIRLGKPLAEAGFGLYPNAERCLRPLDYLCRVYPQHLLDETLAVMQRCHFSLDELRYEYPEELVPAGKTASVHLRELTQAGMRQRWPQGVPQKVLMLVERELRLIAELQYESYFLTVHDIVRFARSRGILCQGRGSAANSAVCYCLHVTEVDPGRMEVLFERFISRERDEPPDIDIDFEHQRREEVIQYIYTRYSRRRAALAATVITYRPRSAIRDVGKALGLNQAQISTLASSLQWWDGDEIAEARIREAGLDPTSRVIRQLLSLVGSLIGFPRHLSQHVGGFVIARDDLTRLVPVENAAMPERTVIQWDKDDLQALGLLKVDILGLGMLTAIQRSLSLINGFYGRSMTVADIPTEDPAVYEMICRADTIGVFQIESRAQMSMLPRLQPRCYYDLVIEVAIIRPGPIQGGMVHPYLRRRKGEEAITYPSQAVKAVLERTLGVPIFQEQVMQLAIVAAGFSGGEADQLRRAMATWKRRGGLDQFRDRLIEGMSARGYAPVFAEQIFNQIKGFGEYGFPESHSASFALLAYISAWLKQHEPAAFFCALLNSQPMGFYAPAQLVRAARAAGVTVLPVCVRSSDIDSTLQADALGCPQLRLGLDRVKGLSVAAAERIVTTRSREACTSIAALARQARLDRGDMEALAAAGAFSQLSGNRFQARWEAAGVEPAMPLFPGVEYPEARPMLRSPQEGEEIVADYRSLGLTLRRHPLALLRERLNTLQVTAATELDNMDTGTGIRVAGLVTNRQRPSSAAGVTFVTLEDETGYLNLIVWESVAQRDRSALLAASLLCADGQVQKEEGVIHVVVNQLHDLSMLLGRLNVKARNFH